MLEEHVFDPVRHDRAGFSCGVSALDDYLHRFAAQQRRKGVASVFVLTDNSASSEILGYYTLSAAQVDVASLSSTEQKKLPRYPVPCFRMGRLACQVDRRGQVLGKLLIGCAVERCLQARQQVAAYALIVDAKDATAQAFYQHYGFKSCADAPLTLYLPLGAA